MSSLPETEVEEDDENVGLMILNNGQLGLAYPPHVSLMCTIMYTVCRYSVLHRAHDISIFIWSGGALASASLTSDSQTRGTTDKTNNETACSLATSDFVQLTVK